jgi:AhpD family alkylhydroperoxidase
MSRISLTPRRTLMVRLGEWYSRRNFGKVLEPGLVFGHNPKVLRSYFRFEMGGGKWNALDPALKHLAVMVTSARVGCAWCVDFGYWEAERLGLPAEKIGKVPEWREHPAAFSEVERDVMAYAEAMTATPPEVGDELAARLLAELGEAAMVELAAMVALENLRSRVNAAMGLTSQGFSESCAVRPSAGAGVVVGSTGEH